MSQAEIEEQARSWRELVKLARAHPGLRVGIVFHDDETSVAFAAGRELPGADPVAALQSVANAENLRSMPPPRPRDTLPSPHFSTEHEEGGDG